MTPTVSVILPTYNRRQYLSRALASIFSQTYKDYEVIVVDDGSTDGSSEWVQQHCSQVRLFKLVVNRGAAVARNTGICQAKGKLVAFLDSDDLWLPDYLQRQVQALEAHPEAVLVYCNYIQRLSGYSQGTRVNLKPPHADLIVSMLLGNFIHTLSQVLFPAAVLQQVGLLDERLSICHDRELYLRLFQRGFPLHVPEYLVQKFWLPNSLVTQSNCQYWLLDGLKLLDIFYSRPEHTRYVHLRPRAEQSLRSRVESSQQYFSQIFNMTAEPRHQLGSVKAICQTESSAKEHQQVRAADYYETAPDLWLVTCYFNPSHYQTKLANYHLFKQRIQAAGIKLLTVECAFGDASYDLAPAPDILQVRCPHIMWQKERLLNLAIASLPKAAEKIAWLDCDILFSNPAWAVETAQLLEQFPVVQPFTVALRLPKGHTFFNGIAEMGASSFAHLLKLRPDLLTQGNFHRYGHPGYAWAARRELLQKHGLYDRLIVGSADLLMAHAMCNDFNSPCMQRHLKNVPSLLSHFTQWGKPFCQDVQGKIGYTSGAVLHLWHGALNNRKYVERHEVLAKYSYNPKTDICVGQSGAWEWNSQKPELHRWLIDYFNQREEDGDESEQLAVVGVSPLPQ